MLDRALPLGLALGGDDRSPPLGLPPEAPLAMPAQVIERRGRRQARQRGRRGSRLGWLRFLVRRAV